MTRQRTLTGPRTQNEEAVVGKRFADRYLVLSRVESGRECFYRAIEIGTDRFVTIMMLETPGALQRMRGLDHPAIVSVIDVTRLPSGRAFAVLEPFDGPTVSTWIQRLPARDEQRLSLVVALAAALDALRERRLMLGRIDPAAVYLLPHSEGYSAKLLPIGIEEAKAHESPVAPLATFTQLLLGRAHWDEIELARSAPTAVEFARALRRA